MPQRSPDQEYADYKRDVIMSPPSNVEGLLTKWHFHVEEAATRLDGAQEEDFSQRLGIYTLVPDSEDELEDVSRTVRSNDETFVAYSQALSPGVQKILRMLREDGLPADEAWLYVLLLQDFLREWPIDPYFDAFGFVPAELWMLGKFHKLNTGFGNWIMSPTCIMGCVKYLLTHTQYPPFPSTALLEAAKNIEQVTAVTIRNYFGDNLILSDDEWLKLAALYVEGYSIARILQLATNYGLACAKLENSDICPPLDGSEVANRENMFERLRLEELFLAGPFGVYSERDQRALAADENSSENELLMGMWDTSTEPEKRAILFRAHDRGVSLQRINLARAFARILVNEERREAGPERSPAAEERSLKILEQMLEREQVEASDEESDEDDQ
ncbi:hypothetical protein EYC84_007341 [Monilinia fructicola]|uniref:Uncharacterized protein n=1 Tax=Monilinia fructicola TaxID=38448 RepID=A0A5M9JMQ2_MONFR|nr:hypothetical protein EYC84_007341 [Monilinia fructicola]